MPRSLKKGPFVDDHLLKKVDVQNEKNSKQVIKQLEADGWFLVRVRGSHHQFKHPSKPGLVTVKHPDSDIPAGTFNSIRKQAGWK